MTKRQEPTRVLLVLMVIYGAASLIHFIHNAEFLVDYPNLPASWSRTGVYTAWAMLIGVGVVAGLLLVRGYRLVGLILAAVYAVLGLASLGHYALAPLTHHSAAMNATILFEVSAAALVLIETAGQLTRHIRRYETKHFGRHR